MLYIFDILHLFIRLDEVRSVSSDPAAFFQLGSSSFSSVIFFFQPIEDTSAGKDQRNASGTFQAVPVNIIDSRENSPFEVENQDETDTAKTEVQTEIHTWRNERYKKEKEQCKKDEKIQNQCNAKEVRQNLDANENKKMSMVRSGFLQSMLTKERTICKKYKFVVPHKNRIQRYIFNLFAGCGIR